MRKLLAAALLLAVAFSCDRPAPADRLLLGDKTVRGITVLTHEESPAGFPGGCC